jgi:hypothetical protein
LVYFLPYLPNLEWLEEWIKGLDLLLFLLGILTFLFEEEGGGIKENKKDPLVKGKRETGQLAEKDGQ